MGLKEPFKERSGKQINGLIINWISKDTLTIHDYRADYAQPKDTFPISAKYEYYEGIVIKKVKEQPINSGGYAGIFKFDSLKIHDCKISFYGVDTSAVQGGHSGKIRLTFQLGSVTISSDKDLVTKIDIDKQFKSMNFSRIDETGKWLHGQPEVSLKTYELIPKTKINSNSLGEVGIFKEWKR